MTFLNSAFLIGLAAAAIPIIIHFLTRQKAKTVLFSSLRFLKELENRQIKRIKIRQILLLLIRTLIILLLGLAFARPTIKGSMFSGIGSSAATSAVIILDNSLSMGIKSGGQLLYDKAKKASLELEALFSFGDEIFCIYATSSTPSLFDGARYNFEAVKKAINNSQVSQSSTDLISAVIKAKEILASSANINKEIYVISDFQQTSIKDFENLAKPLIEAKKAKLFFIPINQEKVNNLVITKVQSANQIIEKGKVFELQAAVKNVADVPARNKLVQIMVDGKRAGQTIVNLEPGASTTASFKIVPAQAGMLNGYAFLEDDDLHSDNKRFFTFYVPEQIHVLLLSNQEKDIRFLRLALNPARNTETQIVTDFKKPDQVEFNTLKNCQVLIVSNVPRLDGALLGAIANFVDNGGSMILFPGTDIDLRNYNEGINKMFSLPVFTETVGQIGQSQFNLTLGKVDFGHLIFSGVFDEDKKQIDSPMFYFVAKIKIQPSHEKIIEYSNGDPFLIEAKAKKGRVLLFTSTIDPDWADLYLKGIFVPLMHRCVAYLAANPERTNEEILVNDELTARLTNIENYQDFYIQTPDNKIIKVSPQPGEGAVQVNFSNTNSAGIYSLFQDKDELTQWAVNTDPDESEAKMFDLSKLREIVGEFKNLKYEGGQKLVDEIRSTRYGKELWKYFVAAVLLLLIAEMLLARESKSESERISAKKFGRAT